VYPRKADGHEPADGDERGGCLEWGGRGTRPLVGAGVDAGRGGVVCGPGYRLVVRWLRL
jgi:hypothetical protein